MSDSVMSFEQRMEQDHPDVNWRMPIAVTADRVTRFCCRFCIARDGLKASELGARGFLTNAECHLHLLAEHAEGLGL